MKDSLPGMPNEKKDMKQAKPYDLKTEWRHFWPAFAIGFLLIPAAGTGLLVWGYYLKKLKTETCRITNTGISIIRWKLFSGETDISIPLHDLLSCRVESTRMQKRMGLGNIILQYVRDQRANHVMETILYGIADPEPVAALLEQAAASEKERREMRREIERNQPSYPYGVMERKNELVGLWQQGLLSEEEYRREAQKFQ